MAISRPARGSTARAACSSVNGGGKVDHMGGSMVGLRLRSGTFCRRRQRGSTGAEYAGSSGLINIKRDDALLHLLAGNYHNAQPLALLGFPI